MPDMTASDIQSLLRDRNNWGRWGADDQMGAVNLITPQKRAAAARLVPIRSRCVAEPRFPDEGRAEQSVSGEAQGQHDAS